MKWSMRQVCHLVGHPLLGVVDHKGAGGPGPEAVATFLGMVAEFLVPFHVVAGGLHIDARVGNPESTNGSEHTTDPIVAPADNRLVCGRVGGPFGDHDQHRGVGTIG